VGVESLGFMECPPLLSSTLIQKLTARLFQLTI
jgi:hypothetical protein